MSNDDSSAIAAAAAEDAGGALVTPAIVSPVCPATCPKRLQIHDAAAEHSASACCRRRSGGHAKIQNPEAAELSRWHWQPETTH